MYEDIRLALGFDGASLAVIDGGSDAASLPNGPKHEPVVSAVPERSDAVTANEFPNELRLLHVVRFAVEQMEGMRDTFELLLHRSESVGSENEDVQKLRESHEAFAGAGHEHTATGVRAGVIGHQDPQVDLAESRDGDLDSSFLNSHRVSPLPEFTSKIIS